MLIMRLAYNIESPEMKGRIVTMKKNNKTEEAKSARAAFKPFEQKPKKMEDLMIDWKKLYPKPYDKKKVDPWTKCRVILMNGIEVEAVIDVYKRQKEDQIRSYTRLLNKEVLAARLQNMGERMKNYDIQIKTEIKHLYHQLVLQYNNYRASIENLSPMSAFERGYAVAMRDDVEIRSVNDVAVGDEIRILLKDGTVLAGVKSKEVQ